MRQIDISKPTHPKTFTLIDSEDFDIIKGHKFRAVSNKSNTNLYARSKAGYMHQLILRCPTGFEIDHSDGNGLNKQKANLRVCTHKENTRNVGIRSDNKSGFKGVFWDTDRNKWKAVIQLNGEKMNLGRFFCIVKAARWYDKAAKLNFGEFAWLNFPE